MMNGVSRGGAIVTISRLEMALFVQEMQAKMDKRQDQYGDSWKTMSIEDLTQRLNEEIEEWRICRMGDPKELVDIANCAMMVYNACLRDR